MNAITAETTVFLILWSILHGKDDSGKTIPIRGRWDKTCPQNKRTTNTRTTRFLTVVTTQAQPQQQGQTSTTMVTPIDTM